MKKLLIIALLLLAFALVSCDGETPVSIGAGCSVVVQKAAITADFIRIKSDSFIEILNTKMLHP